MKCPGWLRGSSCSASTRVPGNVTDSYLLSRAGRLRTDLGGLYFNAAFMLAPAGLYAATSDRVLLLVIAATHLEMLEQLLPFVRFDGYFILTDLAGVPDLFALTTAAAAGHRYALAALDAIGVASVALSLAGSLAVTARLSCSGRVRRLRWPGPRRGGAGSRRR